MCDDERYRAMKIADEAEDRFGREELSKRIEPEGSEIGFDYDNLDKKPVENPQPSQEISLHQLATVIGKLNMRMGAKIECILKFLFKNYSFFFLFLFFFVKRSLKEKVGLKSHSDDYSIVMSRYIS